MFTGIIETVGRIEEIESSNGGKRLRLRTSIADELHVDQSIAISGVCLTVVALPTGCFEVVAVEETLRKTIIGDLAAGDAVNIERAVTPSTRLDGHIVQGHVDATGVVESVVEEGTGRLYTISFDRTFAPYLIPTGSIAVDGISLTIARLEESHFTVAIIPYTYENTTAQHWHAGGRVNLEFDLLGKYVARWLGTQSDSDAPISHS